MIFSSFGWIFQGHRGENRKKQVYYDFQIPHPLAGGFINLIRAFFLTKFDFSGNLVEKITNIAYFSTKKHGECVYNRFGD